MTAFIKDLLAMRIKLVKELESSPVYKQIKAIDELIEAAQDGNRDNLSYKSTKSKDVKITISKTDIVNNVVAFFVSTENHSSDIKSIVKYLKTKNIQLSRVNPSSMVAAILRWQVEIFCFDKSAKTYTLHKEVYIKNNKSQNQQNLSFREAKQAAVS